MWPISNPAGASLVANFSTRLQRPLADATRIPSLIVEDFGQKRIDLYNENDMKIGDIDTNVGAVAMDKQGGIYVANFVEYSYKFKIFMPPYTGPPTVIKFYNGLNGVAVDSTTGVFAVPGFSAVSFFRHGSTTPCAVVKEPDGLGEFGAQDSFDASSTLYLDYLTAGGEGVASIAGECNATTVVQYSKTIRFIGALAFNHLNQLVIQQLVNLAGGTVFTYAHPTNGKFGNLISTTTLANIDGKSPLMSTFTSDGKGLWAAPFFGSGIGLFNYPAGGKPVRLIRAWNGNAAVYPPLVP